MLLKKGDLVTISGACGYVTMVSENGQSIGIMLQPDEVIRLNDGIIAGFIPITYCDGNYLLAYDLSVKLHIKVICSTQENTQQDS